MWSPAYLANALTTKLPRVSSVISLSKSSLPKSFPLTSSPHDDISIGIPTQHLTTLGESQARDILRLIPDHLEYSLLLIQGAASVNRPEVDVGLSASDDVVTIQRMEFSCHDGIDGTFGFGDLMSPI